MKEFERGKGGGGEYPSLLELKKFSNCGHIHAFLLVQIISEGKVVTVKNESSLIMFDKYANIHRVAIVNNVSSYTSVVLSITAYVSRTR